MFKKKVIIPLILIILTACGLFYWQFKASKNALSESKKAKAYENILGRDIKQQKVIKTNEYSGEAFSLKYPSNFSVKEATISSETKNETLRLISTEPRLNLTVLANDANGSSLSDYSAIKFRIINPQDYKMSKTKVSGKEAIQFDKTGSELEKSVFFKKGEKIISISVTGSNKDEAEKVFQQAVESIVI